MFPFTFPETVLEKFSGHASMVLDPFCGRGTTNLASRNAGLPTIGIDSNPVAVAIAQAKLIHAEPQSIVDIASEILDASPEPLHVPQGEFWKLAFDPVVLQQLCAFREELERDCQSHDRVALRAIVLGALHGPMNKGVLTYFSNQCPRTFAPKPAYAVRFWRERSLLPPTVNVIEIISRRARRYFGQALPPPKGRIKLGDSRDAEVYADIEPSVGLVITSPPFYGMRTYIPDQWLRGWFLGGPETVNYSNQNQLGHASAAAFAAELSTVWRNVASIAQPGAKMIVRFGAINDRQVDPRKLIQDSLNGTEWKLFSVTSAGTAQKGRRQANHFVRNAASALEEYDVVAALE